MFFGFIYPDSGKEEPLSRDLTFSDVEAFGSRLAHKAGHNKGRKFAFKLESISPRFASGVRNMGDQKPVINLIETWNFK